MSKLSTRSRWTSADLVYDPDAHTSTTPDGKTVPHVTAVLQAAGLTEDFDRLREMAPRIGQAITLKRDLGQVVHADCHAYDDNDIVWDTVSPESRPYVETWMLFRQAQNLTPINNARERRIYHPIYHYAGILDGVFQDQLEQIVLVDIKSGDPDSAAADLQTAAYQAAWNHEHPLWPITRRLAVWLRPGTRMHYQVHDYSSRYASDLQKFLACLCVYNEQVARGRRS